MRDSLPSHFFFAFEDDTHVKGQRLVGGEQRLERLDLRPNLTFVVDGAAGVEVAIAFRGLEGRRKPFVERDRRAERRSVHRPARWAWTRREANRRIRVDDPRSR